jgi:MraZ protein
MRTGQYGCTIDEKGRILVPSKVRAELEAEDAAHSVLVVTKAVERCLLLFTPAQWEVFSDDIMKSTSLGKEKSRVVVRWIIAPAQEIEVDRSGRIMIPAPLRAYASLSKDTVLLWMMNRMEIWDAAAFDGYLDENEENVKEAMEMLPISY